MRVDNRMNAIQGVSSGGGDQGACDTRVIPHRLRREGVVAWHLWWLAEERAQKREGRVSTRRSSLHEAHLFASRSESPTVTRQW
jgi:hypothetical protein